MSSTVVQTPFIRFRERLKFYKLSLWLFLWIFCGVGCGGFSVSDAEKKQSAIESVHLALSSRKCSQALMSVQPFYSSPLSDSSVRQATAATYGCFASFDFFKFASDLMGFTGNWGGSGFWEFLAAEFPSHTSPVDDRIPKAAELGIDALLAMLQPGIVLDTTHMIQTDPNNIQSLLPIDRMNEANIELGFLAMTLMGSLQNRYGLPTAQFHKSTPLPWISPTLVDQDGCSFVSALLHFSDSLGTLIHSSSKKISGPLTTIQASMTLGLDAACVLGCSNCGGSVHCSSCPTSLRDRTSCQGSVTDANSCAAAALVQLVNAAWVGPP